MWKITAFKQEDNDDLLLRDEDGRFYQRWLMYRPTEAEALKEPGYTIFSAMRKDGVEFKIGDRITHKKLKIDPIIISQLYFAEKDCLACGDFDLAQAKKINN